MLLFLALSFYPSPAWPGLIRAPVLTALRTAPVITIKQLLSLDIIKAGLYVEGRVNPQDPSLGVEEGAWGGGGRCLKWKLSRRIHITIHCTFVVQCSVQVCACAMVLSIH